MTKLATAITAATSPSTPVPPQSPPATVAVLAAPIDRACGYWCKVIRAHEPIPMPSDCTFADDIPYPYLMRNELVQLYPGDLFLEGEAVHKSKKRGWNYWVTFVSNGESVVVRPDLRTKKLLKSAGLPKKLMAGSGKIAAILRVAHAHRAGVHVSPSA